MTTPARQPHPKRCETCDHCKPSEKRKGYHKCEVSNYLLDSASNIIEMTAIVGCASHSATHTSPPAPAQSGVWSADPKKGCKPCMNTECQYCAMKDINIKEHDAQVAKAAREQVLDKIIEHRKTMSKICDVQTAWEKEGLLLVSLRAQQEHPSTKGGDR